jgi:hypothetical protein
MLYALIILAHVLADFSFQSNTISQKKQEQKKYMGLHLLIVFLISLILALPYLRLKLLLILFIITLSHGIIDYIKIYGLNCLLNNSTDGKYNLEIFLLDQVLHILVIGFFIPSLRQIEPVPWFCGLHEYLSTNYTLFETVDKNMVGYIALVLAIIVFNFKGSTIIIRSVLKRYKSDLTKNGAKGEAIGNLERLLVISFVFLKNYPLVGLLFTAKSLIRFKDIETNDQDDFVEYYLIGSFISIFLGIISGVLINRLQILLYYTSGG